MRAASIVQSLLSNYIQQLKCPAQLQTNQSHHGVLRGVTSAIACMYYINVNLHKLTLRFGRWITIAEPEFLVHDSSHNRLQTSHGGQFASQL